ncbi:major facilitator superfamily domain-containing protein [Mycena floridula]|nr:major facilitator superfamily domain-containing protein [Mycena floridula]
MIILYRYVKRKRAEAKAKQEASLEPRTGPSESAVLETSVTGSEHLEPSDNSSATAPPVVAKKTKIDWRWQLRLAAALAIPIILETLDYTVVATAQTHIASIFNRLDIQSYIGTAYLLTATVFLPFFASIADIYGRYIALQLSFVFFIVGSALSTGAVNMEMMLAGRGVAGVGAAGLMVVVRIIMADSSSLDQNNSQATIMFILYTIGFSVGPYIGGVLVDVSYRWIFAINLPACVVAMILSFLLLRRRLRKGEPSKLLPSSASALETFSTKLMRIDWIGTLLFVTSGILILLALNWGSTQEWSSARVIVSFVVGGILMAACLTWQAFLQRYKRRITPNSSRILCVEPMIPLDIFTYDVCATSFGSFVGGMVNFVMFYFVAIFMTIVLQLPASEAGVQLLFFAPGMGGGAYLSMFMIRWFRQPKYPILLGSLILPIGLGLVAMAMEEDKEGLVKGFMALAGVGCGLTVGSLVVHARFSQPRERVAVVSAMLLFFRQLGGTVGLAQCSAVLNNKVRSTLIDAVKSGRISLSDAGSLTSVSSQDISSLDSIAQLPPAVQSVVRDAFKEGSRWAFISIVPWAAVGFVLVLFLSKIKDTRGQEGGDETEKKETSP